MLDMGRCDPVLLDVVDVVAAELLAHSTRLRADDIMVVGAHCRDILQSSLGHAFRLRATTDLDLGLAVANWPAYDELTKNLPATGGTGIRYRVANINADLMPFGSVENPPGTVTPAARKESMSVWGFSEVFRHSLPLGLPSGRTIRIPTAAGYAALKLVAWLDRSVNGDYKDAIDIATILYWYTRSPEVDAYLYDTEYGQSLLLEEESDSVAAAVRVLGEDVAGVLGTMRTSELAQRWPGSRKELLCQNMAVMQAPGWPPAAERLQELVQAFERGVGMGSATERPSATAT